MISHYSSIRLHARFAGSRGISSVAESNLLSLIVPNATAPQTASIASSVVPDAVDKDSTTYHSSDICALPRKNSKPFLCVLYEKVKRKVQDKSFYDSWTVTPDLYSL